MIISFRDKETEKNLETAILKAITQRYSEGWAEKAYNYK